MKLTVKQKEMVEKFKSLQDRHNNKVFISARIGNKPRIMRLDDEEEMLVTIGGEFGGVLNQRVLNGLDRKGLIQPVDINFNYLTDEEVQESLYNDEVKLIGAIII